MFFAVKLNRLKSLAYRLLLTLSLLVITVCAIRYFPKQPLSQRFPLSRAVFAADGELLSLQLASDQRYRYWVKLDSIAPSVIQATLLKEDRWFYYHPGVNPYRLVLAAGATYSGGARQGASTLTMQLARLVYGVNSKTIAGKIQQIGYALWLEASFNKHELLEAYLNLAPYGGNVEGVGSASYLYFDKPPKQLSLSDAVTLAVMPQQPTVRGKTQYQKELTSARDLLVQLWLEQHPGKTDQALKTLLGQTVQLQRSAVNRAPHFVRLALQSAPEQTIIHSYLDLKLQNVLQARMQTYLNNKRSRGLNNAAILLVDTQTQAIKAYLGSGDFSNPNIDGEVDGLQAKRSPGSTLKPLVYGLALDQGLIHAKTLLRDVPVSFGYFAPENFDRKFQGPLNATEALIRSRNTPAVYLAAQLKPDLYQSLENLQFRNLASREHYGLALALGGGEVTALELAQIYIALGNQGVASNPRPHTYEAARSHQVLSAESAFIVRRMLEHNPRPNDHRKAEQLPIAWKTGTSWGFRDAWSAGLFGQYALIVWVGNFDGQSHPALVGRNAAAPLFFSIAEALIAERAVLSQGSETPSQLNIRTVEICSSNGELPNRWCPSRESSMFIPGTSPIQVSQLHDAVAMNIEHNEVDCNPQAIQKLLRGEAVANRRLQIIERWPPILADAFKRAGVKKNVWPKCDTQFAELAPELIQPIPDVIYKLDARTLKQETVSLLANANSEIYWFADQAFIGSSKSGERIAFAPGRFGQIKISASDASGNSTERTLRLEAR